MKKTILMLVLIFGGSKLYAQQGDTTKIKLGDTKIIIIENEKNSKTKQEKKEQALKDFNKLLEEKQRTIKAEKDTLDKLAHELESNQKKLEAQQDEQLKKEEALKNQQLNKQMDEVNKKVDDLNKEVEAINKGIEGLSKKEDDKFDKDADEWAHKKFDWDFDRDWSHDWDHVSPFGHKGKFKGHWAGFEIGLNNYMNKDQQLTFNDANRGFELNGGRSWTYAVNFLEFNIPFGKFAGLVSGLGTSWNNYRFRNNINFHEDSLGIMVATPETSKSYSKNTLHTWNFTVPLIFEFQIPSDKKYSGVYLAFGAYGTATVSSWTKAKYDLDGVSYKERRKSDFQINNLRYGLTARIGLKYLRLFANYDMVPLFQKDRGPELYPVSLGITLISF